MLGEKEERAAMKEGPQGKIIGEFADSTETVDHSNLLLHKRPAGAQKKPAACKKPAAAPAPLPDSDDMDEEEEVEEEEAEEEEEEEEEEAEPAPVAAAVPDQ